MLSPEVEEQYQRLLKEPYQEISGLKETAEELKLENLRYVLRFLLRHKASATPMPNLPDQVRQQAVLEASVARRERQMRAQEAIKASKESQGITNLPLANGAYRRITLVDRPTRVFSSARRRCCNPSQKKGGIIMSELNINKLIEDRKYILAGLLPALFSKPEFENLVKEMIEWYEEFQNRQSDNNLEDIKVISEKIGELWYRFKQSDEPPIPLKEEAQYMRFIVEELERSMQEETNAEEFERIFPNTPSKRKEG